VIANHFGDHGSTSSFFDRNLGLSFSESFCKSSMRSDEFFVIDSDPWLRFGISENAEKLCTASGKPVPNPGNAR
jgi:hypothetical protein